MVNFALGSRRFVILTKNYAIKIPIFWDWVAFIAGIRENLEERYWWCSESGVRRDNKWYHHTLARIHWASRFGLCNVMERCDMDWHSDEHTEYEMFKAMDELKKCSASLPFVSDMNVNNVGWTRDGRLVVTDYGYFGGCRDCYLGCPNGFSLMKSLRMNFYKLQRKWRKFKRDMMVNPIVYDRKVSISYKARDRRKRNPPLNVELMPVIRNPTTVADSILTMPEVAYVNELFLQPLRGDVDDDKQDEDSSKPLYRHRVLRVRATDDWDVAVTVERRSMPERMDPMRPFVPGTGTFVQYYVVERARYSRDPKWERALYIGTDFHEKVARPNNRSWTLQGSDHV